MSLPWKIKLMISAYSRIRKACFRHDFTINRRLLRLFDPKTPPTPPSSVDVTVDPSRDLWFRQYTPSHSTAAATATGDTLPVVVYFHGGGFATNSANTVFMDSFARRVANHVRSIVISVNYRLAPEHRCPAQYDDGFDVVKFLDSVDPTRLPPGTDLGRCFIMGDSAGGNLGHHVVARAGACKFERVRLRGLIAVQPFFGGEERTESEIRIGNGAPGLSVDRADWFWKAFLPKGSNRNHPAANVFGPNSARFSGSKFPNTLVVIGGSDPLQDWQRKYCKGLESAGVGVRLVEYPNAFHGSYVFEDLPESSLMLDEIGDFMSQQLKVT
ncbi:probable carboxylesterase 18 [Arachis stenosperma]|uniref:probable carboxylesterase 18 n=1 Tax=Arachis stenosperma TaxID=217475 RepID=UPI0025AD697A|nr:probable carboxylesterase 18 [Arachis stenosperma]